VQIGDGPAAVTGDENRSMSLSFEPRWEGAVSRMIRKSEDLPESFYMLCLRGQRHTLILRIKKGNPRIDRKSVRGFFLPGPLVNNKHKEKENETGTGAIENDSSVDQGLGWFPDSHAAGHVAVRQEVEHMKRIIGNAILSALLVLPATVLAEESQENMKTLEEVVVTATRHESDTRSIPANVTVITAEEIADAGVSSIIEVLEKQGNVLFNSYSGYATEAQVDLRGFGTETGFGRTLVLLDGRRLNRPDMSSINWTQLPVEQIERIEIVRGSSSVLYGDSAVAGVIHIISKKGAVEPSITGSLQIGEDEFHSESASIIGSTESLSYSFSGSNQQTDGWRDRTGYHSYGGALQLGYDLSDSTGISGGISYNETDYELAGSLNSSQLAADRTQSNYSDHEAENQFLNSSLLLEGSMGKLGDLEVNFVYGDSENSSSQSFFSIFLDSENESVGIQPKYILSTDHGSFSNQLITGVDIYYEDLTVKNFNEAARVNLNSLTEIDKDTVGWYLRDEVSIDNNFIVSGGVRIERSEIHINYNDFVVLADSFNDKKEHDGEVFEFGITWLPTEYIKLFSRFSTLYRYPFVDEQASYAGFLPKNFETAIDAEDGKNIEAGFELNHQDLDVGATFYQIDMEDEIVLNTDAWPFFNENSSDETRHRGIETYINFNPEGLFDLNILYTYQESTYESGSNSGNDIPLVPNHILSASLDISLPYNIHLIPNLRYVSDSYSSGDNSNIFAKLDDYTVVDLLLRYKRDIGKSQITIFLGANNIFDEEYSPYGSAQWDYYYPAPGRKIFGGISGTF
jgi:iron complex outermembrane receptor protein